MPYNLEVYPNPFSDQTTIAINLEKESNISIQLYDLTGKQVVTVLQTNLQTAGEHQYLLDASHLETGIYILMIHIDGKLQSKKLSIMR